jgi:glycosyltransferase involved in cell wall biosynthesis
MARSSHQFALHTLPAHHWKWRMRHGAVTFARQLQADDSPDVLFCTDMLDLATFRGLADASVRGLPAVVYFHENQLTYPDEHRTERDLHFALTNLTTALAADAVWFNSDYHRRTFLDAMGVLLRKMPDSHLTDAVQSIAGKASVHHPGIELVAERPSRQPGPMRIVWAARWEHDKDPQTFFDALGQLQQRGVNFRLSVLGESFEHVPECFGRAREQLADHIDEWGYLPDRAAYFRTLQQADVAVSTARHEFFGLAMVEAVSAGCYPLAPRRLAYPEVLGGDDRFLYEGGAVELADRLTDLAGRLATADLWQGEADAGRQFVQRFAWPTVAQRLDAALMAVAGA